MSIMVMPKEMVARHCRRVERETLKYSIEDEPDVANRMIVWRKLKLTLPIKREERDNA